MTESPMSVKDLIKILSDADPEAWVCFTHNEIVPPIPLKQENIYDESFNDQAILRLDVTGVYDKSIVAIYLESK